MHIQYFMVLYMKNMYPDKMYTTEEKYFELNFSVCNSQLQELFVEKKAKITFSKT